MEYKDILDFWFKELTAEQQFTGGVEIDQIIIERFSDIHAAAVAGELDAWRATAKGSLAEIIVLDQFSRNIYRGKREAFAADGQALTLAQVAIKKNYAAELTQDEKLFLYLPFMHSESKLIHQEALQLFTELGIESSLEYEQKHKAIIDQFGRYPHRNKQLGRESMSAEIQYQEESTETFFAS